MIYHDPRTDAPPTGATVSKADRAMARTRAGLCPAEDCARPLNEDGECDYCRRAE
jgi:hypothetical protein